MSRNIKYVSIIINNYYKHHVASNAVASWTKRRECYFWPLLVRYMHWIMCVQCVRHYCINYFVFFCILFRIKFLLESLKWYRYERWCFSFLLLLWLKLYRSGTESCLRGSSVADISDIFEQWRNYSVFLNELTLGIFFPREKGFDKFGIVEWVIWQGNRLTLVYVIIIVFC